ncbi:MAG: hypothetical protein BWZ07_02443 [Alphaproteobacteria bacterium ADurb.BinA280]|nr:MAG: hypothetical protein BWZ07_02443 [Alphaproteobacteria bacterium ADurb.BinA280]
MPAATDSNTALLILPRRASQTARITWGLTASSTQSASVWMLELSAVHMTPKSFCNASRSGALGSTTWMALA